MHEVERLFTHQLARLVAEQFVHAVAHERDAPVRVEGEHDRVDVREEGGEVATLGIVRIKAAPAIYVERLVDIVNFKRTGGVLQVGTFSSPPQPADVAALTVDERDLKRLRDCRVGDCGIRLSAEGIERFQREIDWNAVDASRRANGLLRQLLVDYVTRYRESGAPAAIEYADTPSPLTCWSRGWVLPRRRSSWVTAASRWS